jgi:co-chaperonin GroES (HSP10)
MIPLFSRVLLERVKADKIGNIHIPEESQKRMAATKCRVLAAGDTCEDSIKSLVGKYVVIGRHAGDWVNADGIPGMPSDDTHEYFICQEEDILASLE